MTREQLIEKIWSFYNLDHRRKVSKFEICERAVKLTNILFDKNITDVDVFVGENNIEFCIILFRNCVLEVVVEDNNNLSLYYDTKNITNVIQILELTFSEE